ncbi:MAG TPA: hypothetical protein VF929_06320 [Gemmatimonadaceae bacterium]
MDACLFEPWKGSSYKDGWRGLRVLLLGESHYREVGKDYSPRDFTSGVVRRWAIDGPTARFFTTTCRAMTGGGIPTLTERTAFWESVAFYNYVQAWVDGGPRSRPTAADWATGPTPFQSVLESLKPDCILVLGQELWWNVPRPASETAVLLAQSGTVTIRLYQVVGRQIPAGMIHHPSSGFSQARWRPHIAALMEYANNHRA